MDKAWKIGASAMALACGLPALAAERALDKSVLVSAGVEAVWQAWTTTEGVTSFFAPAADIEPRVGGAYRVYFDPGAEPGRDPVVVLGLRLTYQLSL